MARLIDIDKAAEAIAWLDEYDFVIWHDVMERIDKQPTVDAEPVVRCENCKSFGEEDEDGDCWCFLKDISTLRYGFCYWGERNDK